tara:strand:+ start:941 stop:2185 length:1245 start_codon:yes stop_codon:yes gene_type:complete
MNSRVFFILLFIFGVTLGPSTYAQNNGKAERLQQLLKQFPAADTNHDGKLTWQEALAYRNKMGAKTGSRNQGRGVPTTFEVDAGWELEKFPKEAVCYMPPSQIEATYAKVTGGKAPAVVSYSKPTDGALRVVGVGHSFMMPGYKTMPLIAKGAGMDQPLYTHIGGGITGSARYKWEQENGIFDFKGKPYPKLLSSIANAEWEAMMFGPYFQDQPKYYSCWIDFCLKYNPEMKFFLSDAWPQLAQLKEKPKSEAFFTDEVLDQLAEERKEMHALVIDPLRKAYPGKVFILPTSDSMVLAAKHFVRGELPGIEGLHQVIGKKERSLWRDQLGHLGPGLERLEGYVFYATLYGKSPELIEDNIPFGGNTTFPSTSLDQMFRKIAWQAVSEHPYSGITDTNGDGIGDAFKEPVLQGSP